MKKILIFAAFIYSSIAANAADMSLPIRGVADGDTILTTLKLPCPLCQASIRIKGIDTPESNHLAKCDLEKSKGIEAKQFLAKYLKDKSVMMARDIKWDKYGGRIVASVEVDGKDIGQLMIERGFAKPYTGQGPKSNWCN